MISCYTFMAFLLASICLSIFYNKSNLMTILVSLELLMFLLLLVITLIFPSLFSTAGLLPLLLCFAASGAAVGLTLLVTLSRLYGNDLIKSIIFEKIPWDWGFT